MNAEPGAAAADGAEPRVCCSQLVVVSLAT